MEWDKNPCVYVGKGKVTAEDKKEAEQAFKRLEKIIGRKITIIE